MPRLLLLLPTTTYRTAAFLGAARKLGVEVVVASERAHVFQQAQPGRFLSLDFLHHDQAARQVLAFAATRPIEGASYPGFIFARAESPERVETALREAHRRLEFVLLARRTPSDAV
jgi:hypothetical protein